jgi:hypothetical protein
MILAIPTTGQSDEVAEPGFVGVGGCKMCHKKEADGNQHGKWLEGRHSKAFETLGGEKAAEIAAGLGHTGSPQELDECLSCHVTAHGVDAARLGKKYSIEEGVGCESCHGPGAVYKKKSIMADREQALAAGLVIPTEETCVTCHNEKSPTFTGFVFDEMVAKIAHPYPEAEVAE